MKVTGLHVFLILLATIVFCSCLGKEKKPIIEGASGSMAASKHHRRNDIERRENQSRKRELMNYRKKEHINKHREYEERLRRLERKERENREYRRKMIEREKKRREEHYDEHDKLYDRTMNEQYDERPDFHVDDHRMKRRTRNRAKMVPLNKHPHDDKYMLKSEIVPPVCPHGGAGGSGDPPGGNNGDRPCPPCARCPEPSFECKKVPNYNSRSPGGEGGLPKPLLTDFSTFGA